MAGTREHRPHQAKDAVGGLRSRRRDTRRIRVARPRGEVERLGEERHHGCDSGAGVRHRVEHFRVGAFTGLGAPLETSEIRPS